MEYEMRFRGTGERGEGTAVRTLIPPPLKILEDIYCIIKY